MSRKVLIKMVISFLSLTLLVSCDVSLPDWRIDRNKNDFQVYPLDIKKPKVEEESNT